MSRRRGVWSFEGRILVIAFISILIFNLSFSPVPVLIRPVSGAFPGANGKIAFTDAREQQIWIVRPNGGPLQLLTSKGYNTHPAWSPDGSKIVFIHYDVYDGYGLFVMNSDGSGKTDLISLPQDLVSHPTWSPDGTKIAYSTIDQIYVINADGTGNKRLTQFGSSSKYPAWSPDGSKIAFISNAFINNPKTWQIWTMDPNGNNLNQLTTDITNRFDPEWSPDGSRIAFVGYSKLTMTIGVWTMKPDGTDQKQLTNHGREPAWSPDGSKIAFVDDRPKPGMPVIQIVVMDADGANVRELAPPVGGWQPSWQPIVRPSFYTDVCCSNYISLNLGSSTTASVEVHSVNGFISPVDLSASWVGAAPTGVDFTLSSPVVGNATIPLIITASSSASTGNYTLRVTGTSGSLSDSVDLTLLVTSTTITTTTASVPDFYMFTCCVSALSVAQGGNDSTTIIVNPVNGFSAPVTLTSSWLGPAPVDVSVSFSSNTIGGTTAAGEANSLLTVTAGGQADLGLFELEVTGTRYLPYVPANGSLTHTIYIPVLITGTTSTVTTTTTSSTSTGMPDFSISSPRSPVYLTQGSNATVAITVTPLNGFNSTVDLSWSWLGTTPAGVFLSWEGNRKCFLYPEGWLCPDLRLTASPSFADLENALIQRNFTLSITGNSGSLSHSVDVAIVLVPLSTSTFTPLTSSTSPTANPPPGKCLIATATYGSELSPEVQLLRNFRDNSILKTRAGSSFMVAFNAWYYSFSPNVANYLTAHAVERTIMKGALYPLVAILFVSSSVFSATSAFPELAALLSGLLASALIGAFYLGLPLTLIRTKIRRLGGWKMQKALQKILSLSLLIGIAGIILGEFLTYTPMLIVSTSVTILGALFLAAWTTSATLSKLLMRFGRHKQ